MMNVDDDPAAVPPLRFSCTACGRCCHGLRLMLSIDEAIMWLQRGGRVELLCDAAPALSFPPQSGEAYRAARAAPAISGGLPLTIAVILTATFDGPCPNLRPDMLCGAYEVRPQACRIYPAEIRPDRSIAPGDKLCPPEAWGGVNPIFRETDGRIADHVTAVAIDRARSVGLEDVERKAALLAFLEIDQVALANEGYAVWKPDDDRLLEGLTQVAAGMRAPNEPWRVSIISPRPETRLMITEAEGVAAEPDPSREYDYLALFA